MAHIYNALSFLEKRQDTKIKESIIILGLCYYEFTDTGLLGLPCSCKEPSGLLSLSKHEVSYHVI